MKEITAYIQPHKLSAVSMALRQLEILCRDDPVEYVIDAIEHAARTGLRGDGKIYVTPVETAVRISTGERGEEAI